MEEKTKQDESQKQEPKRGKVVIASRLRKESVKIDKEGRIVSRKVEWK
jgi:hypothetical protein